MELRKTPMQKALDRVCFHENSTKSLMNRETLRRLRITLEDMLKEEEELIKQCFVDGSKRVSGEITFNGEQYYSQNFEKYVFDTENAENIEGL